MNGNLYWILYLLAGFVPSYPLRGRSHCKSIQSSSDWSHLLNEGTFLSWWIHRAKGITEPFEEYENCKNNMLDSFHFQWQLVTSCDMSHSNCWWLDVGVSSDVRNLRNDNGGAGTVKCTRSMPKSTHCFSFILLDTTPGKKYGINTLGRNSLRLFTL